MQVIPFDCPVNVFPNAFQGNVSIGILELLGPKTPTVWLIFKIEKGSTIVTYGVASKSDNIPTEVADQKPVVVAIATRSIWMLLVNDEEEFYQRVADAKIHIAGDYRIFGRYALSFLRATRSTNLWKQLDKIIYQVVGEST